VIYSIAREIGFTRDDGVPLVALLLYAARERLCRVATRSAPAGAGS
jgi:hypothetical protein